MSNLNVFQNTTKTAPKRDSQIIRVSMEENEIGGRKDHMPAANKSGDMALSHVPSAGSKV